MRAYNRLFFLSLMFLLLSNCGQDAQRPEMARGNDPWVFRSVLDGQARMLTVALHNGIWAAYSAQNGNLYKLWRGDINFDGAVYTTVHGPQPSSLGDAYFINTAEEPWAVLVGGQPQKPRIQYRGHRFKGGQVYINYDLALDDGRVIKVSERPEYITRAEGKQPGFERTFFVEGLPGDCSLQLAFNFSSLPSIHNIETNGELEVLAQEGRQSMGLQTIDLSGLLHLQAESPTRLAAYFTRLPLIDNPNRVESEGEEEELLPRGARLIARSDCKSCHNTYLKTIGPSYADVAQRYDNTPENVQALATKVKNGGAGVWGEAAMTAHPGLDDIDLKAMIEYIMDLDAEEEKLNNKEAGNSKKALLTLPAAEGLEKDALLPGLLLRVFQFNKRLAELADVNFRQAPLYEAISSDIYVSNSEFRDLEANFAMSYDGYLYVPKDNNYVLRLRSDDGSRLLLDGQEVINYDGLHGADKRDGELELKEGLHPLRLEYFQSGGGRFVSLEWRSFDGAEFERIPVENFFHSPASQPGEDAVAPPMLQNNTIPGDRSSLQEVHPSYTLSQARPDDFLPKVGGMDFFSDGRLVVSTWDPEGAVYIVDGVQTGDPRQMSYKKVASGLAEPLGLKVVDDTIYVLQKQELTKLIDHDGDGLIDEYYTLSNDWKVSANFHEFAFGLAYREGFFYAALAIAIMPGGASANPQIPDRGKAVRINRQNGELEFVAQGLRTPNGVGLGVDNEVFIADNQGDWLPSCKILHIQAGDFFGSRAVDSARVAALPVKQPVVWLPQDEIGNSPTTPAILNDGPYKGQMIHGEVTHGGVKRVFVEKVNGQYQGCVFRFIQGLEAGVNRLAWGPDSALYIGGIGSTGNWQQAGKNWYGLQRLKYNGQPTFEMLAVRARSNGMEIEFTEPLEEREGWQPEDYAVQQWWYLPTSEYGGPKKDLERLPVLSTNISEDRRRVFLELEGMKKGHVVYVRIPNDWISANGNELWSTETWYTLNEIPEGKPGFLVEAPPPLPPNTLSEAEKAAGWQLLFDGKSAEGWHSYSQPAVGANWQVVDGALTLSPADGGAGGDILTDKEFEDFELRLEWKIAPCGNSGIFFNVQESEAYDHAFLTGPEMQLLDNTCNPEGRVDSHRAGDLFDLISSSLITVRAAGQWNEARIIVKDGMLQHWLNGRKVVETEMWNSEWKKRVANSKFSEWEGFGESRSGKIALQDHGDRVWFRNIRIREL